MPYAIEAEQSVLGSILLDKDLIIVVIDIVSKEDFYSDQNAEIYDSMLTLFKNSEPIDLITIVNELRKRSLLEKVGGIPYITSLSSAPDFTSHITKYAAIVKEKSILRKLIRTSTDLMQKSYEQSMQIQDILDFAEKSIFDIAQEKDQRGLVKIENVLADSFEILQDLYMRKDKMTGITTGFIDLDRKINGLQKTDLILIAARPAMGKTAFSLNIAQNAAMKGNASVAIFNLEMSKEQLIQRMISSTSHVELNKLKNGNIEDDEWPKITTGMGILQNTKIYIDDSPGITAVELRSKCRRLKVEKGLDLVLIDYLQLMEGDGRTESRQQEISKISRSLKILAKELECPVIALSQLSRAVEQRSDHRPMLSDLRESGAIEQDADLVMFLYRDDYYNPDSDQKNITEVIIAKHRHGEIGTIPLTWFGQYQLFKDASNYGGFN
ncbi:MAG: replicative DNA helicase [Proteocatella sp.]|nr:replicative DNA helicase [Proteocatella sp.]NCB71141.1 replicative DNA helicase [Clostridia bacterium]MBP7913346.1 replicative DNA helicase [Proteocatella sp.]MBP8654331.1 replicative DNA helicase [Proteocatella sp.]MBP9658995.1 replicative DNA helicase [Proteocatella sp.]